MQVRERSWQQDCAASSHQHNTPPPCPPLIALLITPYACLRLHAAHVCSMRRHQAARQRKRGEMKNFKYLMQSLVQQVGWGGGGVGATRSSLASS